MARLKPECGRVRQGSIKGETFEFCYIIEGVIELTPEGGEPVIYRAGDSHMLTRRSDCTDIEFGTIQQA
ncbi:MAG: cupin domain-containing protein [Exilibacterium sp.]